LNHWTHVQEFYRWLSPKKDQIILTDNLALSKLNLRLGVNLILPLEKEHSTRFDMLKVILMSSLRQRSILIYCPYGVLGSNPRPKPTILHTVSNIS
jgi:hypothetical protein